MYENTVITEPKWKSWIIETTTPLFTPDQCRQIIESGRRQPPQKAQVGMGNNTQKGGVDTKKRVTTISWIPFEEMSQMYQSLNVFIQKANLNHFGFDDVRVTEQVQFTEYPTGGFYDWHMDCDLVMTKEPPVRKISMTVLLNHPSEFEGGELEVGGAGQTTAKPMQQGHGLAFASFINHRIKPVTRGMRQSLVCWFGGTPFK